MDWTKRHHQRRQRCGIFYVLGVKLNLNHLTITGGAGHFGGIENDGGTLVVSNSSFSGNNGSEAGAIENDAGMLTVRNSTFMGNSGGEGGAIENDGGTLVVSLTKFSGNRSGYGGGIMNRGSGTGTVRSSTFTGNIAQIDGGGIENDGATLTTSDDTFSDNMGDEGGGIENDGGNCTVRNSTFTNNTGVSVGGGIESAFGSLTLINSTLAGNASGEGGAIAANPLQHEPSTLTLSNTIVVNGCVNSGTLIDGSGNLNWQASACPGIHVDPKLDPSGLLDNGGPTQTMALDTGSPAIGVAVEANCPISDQRGFPRPFTSACSIGAFEPGVFVRIVSGQRDSELDVERFRCGWYL